MQIALFEPDIAQNTGTILRLCACLGVAAHIIEPAGFPVSDRAFRRAGMDYLDQVSITRHDSWAAFEDWRRTQALRLVLFTTRATVSYLDHGFAERRRAAVRPGVVRRSGTRSRRSGRPALDPDAAGIALAQYRDDRRDGGGRGVAADRRPKGRISRMTTPLPDQRDT